MRIYLGGHLNFYSSDQGNWLEVPLAEPMPLEEIIVNLGIPLGEIQLVVLDDELVSLDIIVSDENEVKLFSAVGGG